MEEAEPPGADISVRFTAEAGILPVGQSRHAATVVLRSFSAQPVAGTVRVEGVEAEPAEASFRLERAGEEVLLPFVLKPAGAVNAKAIALVNGRPHTTEIRPVTAPGLRTAYVRKPAVHRVQPVDVRVAPGLRIGYIMGTGDEVPEALRQLGVPYQLLTADDLATGDLSRFTTLLLGIRAYAARDDVRKHNARLLDFARQGGVVIVQYNTQEYDRNYGPYPYTMTARGRRDSEENSPVRMLDAGIRCFKVRTASRPLTLTAGWSSAGPKFWMTWDERYQPLLETNDTGQAPQRGGWLEARTGKGLYIFAPMPGTGNCRRPSPGRTVVRESDFAASLAGAGPAIAGIDWEALRQ